ncbi:MAG: hypothetical protein HY028_05685 [Gammaproteobacteria bacterium]|nr:hypothetical protein [Gammaproteobacteria bacterium]
MSAVVFENYSPGRLDGWRTSLVLHGVLGGLILFAMGAEEPPLPEPFRWDVAFLSAAPAAPMVQPPAPAVTEAVAPVQQQAVVSAAPVTPVIEQAEPSEPPPAPRPSRPVVPQPVVPRQTAPAVTEAVAPVQQQAVVSAAPVTPVIEQAEPSEPEAPRRGRC